MSEEFVLQKDDDLWYLTYTDGGFEETYRFKVMYGSVDGTDGSKQILVPIDSASGFPPKVMTYLRKQEAEGHFTFAPESKIDGQDMQFSS